MKTIFAATVAAATMLAAAAAQAQDWSAAANQDLQAIHDALRDNAPQVYVERDSASFRSTLDAGLAQAKTQNLAKVDNAAAYAYALKAYTGAFRDPNIALAPNWAPPPPWFAITWPGFSTAYKDGAYVVAYNDPSSKGLPPLGAKVISCDKRPVEAIAQERLDRYEADLTSAAGRFQSAPYLLWDRANTMLSPLPQKCDFDVGGRKRTFTLNGQFGGEPQRQAAFLAAAPKPSGISLESFGQGGFWINVHSFDDGQSWSGLFAQVDQNSAAIRNAPVIVIDLRGADTGSIRNGYRLINRLWDPAFILANNPPATKISYRASKANHDFYKALADRLAADPMTNSESGGWQGLVADFDKAIAAGQPLIERNETPTTAESAPMQPIAAAPEPGTAPAPGAAAAPPPPPPPPPPPVPSAPPPNPMKAKVIVLTDYWCAGACLNLLDVLTRLPNVVQVGTQTTANSIFIGQTQIQLPSGQAHIAYGDKAWLDRPRASNQPYTPPAGMTYTGDLADTAALKAWVQQIAAH
jgi:hypothetical protein